MKILIASLILLFAAPQTSSIYSLGYTDVSGNTVSMSQYQGKWILLVNGGTEAPEAAVQIAQLEQFYQLHRDSVVVVLFPSNDFGNEPRSGEDIRLLMQRTYHTSFPVAAVSTIKNDAAGQHPVYNWAQHKTANGIMDIQISKDFQKILVDKQGNITGFFGSKLSPLAPAILQAMQNN